MKHFKTDYNPVTGAREDYYWDDQAQQMTIRNRHDVTDIIESNKAQINDTIDTRYGKEMMHHVADIPLGVALNWKRTYGVDILENTPEAKKFIRKMLNDPDYRYLKRTVKKL